MRVPTEELDGSRYPAPAAAAANIPAYKRRA